MKSIPLFSADIDVSCFSGNKTRTFACTQIQRDIDVLTRTAQELKTRYNSLSITARLPDELLERIFMWNMSIQRKDKYMRYIRVAFVCATWRRIALDCSPLWSFIRQEQLETDGLVANVLLPRSKNAALHIKTHLKSEESWSPIFYHMLDELHRIRELSFSCDDFYFPFPKLHDIMSRLCRPAPLLEKLVVYANLSGLDCCLPSNLFDNHAPKLKTLKLTVCTIRVDSPLLVGLTTLKLWSTGLSIEQLITLLQATPNLKNLNLRDACRSDPVAQPPPITTVTLPYLDLFILSEDSGAQILSCITHPSTTSLIVSSDSLYHTSEYLCALGQQLATCMSYIHHLIIFHQSRDYHLEIYGRRIGADGYSSSIICTVVCHAKTLDHLKILLNTLPLDQLYSLRVVAKLPTGFWIEMFGDLPFLHEISAEGESSQLLRALLCGISQSELAKYLLIRDGDPMDEDSSGSEAEMDADESDVAMYLTTGYVPFGPDDEVEVLYWDSETDIREDGAPKDGCKETSFTDTLAKLRLRRTPATLFFTSLLSLEIDSWNSRSHPLDTTLLAALLYVRDARGSPLDNLNVTHSTHYSPDAEIDVDRMWDFVPEVFWRVTDGLAMNTESENEGENAQKQNGLS
ncbi:hypothetical protein H0H92_002561 [Tricholoma furcatifolium]|nr:hypothetical protein H0H92_002561 [Tricholoma furcatifolium]